jgi:hypothetical protein
MEECNEQINDQNFQNPRTYELQNVINNQNINNQNEFYASNDYNYQTQNNKFEEENESFRQRTYTNKFNNNLQLSPNNNNEDIEMEEIEEDTEQEAVEFIQLQHQKIKKLKKELKLKDDIIKEYKEKMNKINLKNKDEQENRILCNNLRKQIEIIVKEKEELKLELYSKDKLIKELKIDLNDLSKKFNKYNNNILTNSGEKNDKVNQLLQLLKEYTTQLKKNEEKIKLYESEFNKLNQNLTNEMKEKQKLKLLYEDKLKEEKNWISRINVDIQLLCEWMNNYMGIYFDKIVQIPDVPLFTPPVNSENVSTFNRFNFNILRQTIIDVRNKIYNKQSKYENIIQQDKKEQIELLNKIETQNKNIANLNNDIILLKEEISQKKFEIEEMNNKINNLMIQ